MPKLSIRDLDVVGKRVFIRVDFNVPLKDGVIRRRHAHPRVAADDPVRARPTARPSISRATSDGRRAKPNPEMSLKPVAAALSAAARPAGGLRGRLRRRRGQAARRPGARVGRRCGAARKPAVPSRGREERSRSSPAQLASLADLYVDDAFGAAHRAHASVEGITHHLPQAAAGLLMEQELRTSVTSLESPERPFVAILGGAKVSDKIEVIENMLRQGRSADHRRRDGVHVLQVARRPDRRSLVEDDKLDAARAIEADAAGARRSTAAAGRSRRRSDRSTRAASTEVLAIDDPGNRRPHGPGHRSGEPSRRTAQRSRDAKTVVWNGPMGVFEIDAFAAGTNAVARAVAAVHGTTIIGGGDSIAAVKKAGIADTNHAHLDRRRRVARIPRRPHAARRRGADG